MDEKTETEAIHMEDVRPPETGEVVTTEGDDHVIEVLDEDDGDG